jgi:mono/diheme cytochrome c family protein
MPQKNRLTRFVLVSVLLTLATAAWAFPQYARTTKMSCVTCHTNVAGGAALTDAGKAYKADNTKVPAASVDGAEYVGVGKCKACHLKEYKSWQTLDHAKAMETLKSGDAAKIADMATKLNVKLSGPANENDACIDCHAVGHMLAGGYPAADSTKNANLSAVGCESCHGPGSKHVSAEKAVKKDFINGKPSEAMCKSCHNPTMSPKFDLATYKAKGIHEVKTAE